MSALELEMSSSSPPLTDGESELSSTQGRVTGLQSHSGKLG